MPHAKRIAFVVRASARDGLGHLVRALAVAKEVALAPEVVGNLIVLGDGCGGHLLQESRLQHTTASSDDDAATAVRRFRPDVCVFDTLTFSRKAFLAIGSGCTTVSLSPIFSRLTDVDHLIHRTTAESPAWSKESRFPMIHKGLKFTVLGKSLKRLTFQAYHRCLNEPRLPIGISMGGADAKNRTLLMLAQLGKLQEPMVLYIALGDAYMHCFNKLNDCAKAHRQEVIIIKSNESMWKLLRHTALLVTSGGLTTYEAAYIGVPSVNLPQHNNWSFLFSELSAAGTCYAISPRQDSPERAALCVKHMCQNRDSLLLMHKATKGLIPANGSKRVAQLLRQLSTCQ